MPQVSVLVYLMLLFNLSDVNSGNCCMKIETERDIYEDVQGTTQITRRGEDPPSGQVRSSSADTEEKEAANREAFEKNEAANREIARNAFIASRGGVEKFPGEFAWLDEVSSDEAGPSLLLPDRVPAPDLERTVLYLNNVQKAIDLAMEEFEKDHLNVLVRSNELLAQIQEKLEILYSESKEDEDFLRVIHKIVRTYCGDLVHKEQASVSFSHRILPNLYAIQEDGIQYYDRYSSGHIPQPQIAQQRPTDVSGSDIKRDKSNGRTVCRVGAYLAMCKVIRMNLLRSQSKKYRDVISISTKKQHLFLTNYYIMWTNGVKVLKDDKSGFIVTDQIRARIKHLTLKNLEAEIWKVIL